MAASWLATLGAKPPSSPTAVLMPLSCRIFFSAWKTSAPQRSDSRNDGCADRDDHQLLQVEAVVGVRAAIDDVHHRHRQLVGAHAAEIAVQRQARFFGRSAGHGHRDGERGIGAQAGLVVGAVDVDQGLVEEGLLGGVEAQHGLGDFGVDMLDRLQHALAEVTALVAVAQLDRFARAGRGARGHGGAAHHARFQQHIAFDGGVAAAVENFPADDVNNGAHSDVSYKFKKRVGVDVASFVRYDATTRSLTRLRSRSCASPPRLGGPGVRGCIPASR